MPLISWTSDLTVGVSQIDEQHRELFGAVDSLAEAMWAGKGKGEIEQTIDFLWDYVAIHFREEEALMIKGNYPGYSAQKSAHEKFAKEIDEMRTKYLSGEASSATAIELLTQACNWLREHIRVMDKAIGDFVTEKK
jgi:hemerythrin